MGAFVDIVRVVATIMNVVVFLSPLPTVREIYQNKATGHMPIMPLVSMVSNSYIWMMYGYLAKDYIAIFSTCAFGVAASICYVSVYYRYTTERSYAHKVIIAFALVLTVFTTYIILGLHGVTSQSHEGVRKVVGYISIASSLVMYSAPFEKIRQVFKHHSAVFIPIKLVVVGSVNSATWALYSTLHVDWLVFIPNVILLVIGLAQITLYYIFHPATHPLQSTPEDKDLEAAASPTASFVPVRSPLEPLHSAATSAAP